ncbi:hypothetical protein [Spiroplasma ixodetis]|uniref:Uncharacterized protein n=1 Tax=Spiroplasma ixodetis TaxID=2141 RepID=A0ABN6SYE1_9MOLU|nr:hypothetical protein [Spiroplasma ixodetis]BDT04129.1 hypothetical protein SHM_17750 [Spiroplasma ixodetis]
MDNFYAYIPLILKYIVILPYFLKDSKQVLTQPKIKECELLVNDLKQIIDWEQILINSFKDIEKYK